MCGCEVCLPYVGLSAARAFKLILHQVSVVGGGDEVMVEGLAHILEHLLMSGVKDRALLLVQVHEEAILGHMLILLGCGNAHRCEKLFH